MAISICKVEYGFALESSLWREVAVGIPGKGQLDSLGGRGAQACPGMVGRVSLATEGLEVAFLAVSNCQGCGVSCHIA